MTLRRCRTGVLVTVLSLAGLAPLHAATINVPAGGGLQAAINAAATNDTLQLATGNYTIQSGGGVGFRINKNITVQGVAGTVLLVAMSANGDAAGLYFIAGATGAIVRNLTVQVDAAANAGIQIDTLASNVTLSNLTVTNGGIGVVVLGSGATLTGLTLNHPRGVLIRSASNTVLQTSTITATATEGVLLQGASNNVIANNNIVNAATNGILLYPLDPANAATGSNGNLVIGNTIQRTDTQHGIAIQSSDSNVIVANTINNSGANLPPPNLGADGILVLGGQDNRLDRNLLTGFTADGITLTPTPSGTTSPSVVGYRGSIGNYVGKNRVTGASTAHTGIWLNDSSNGSYVFNNTVTTGTEGGITNFNTSASMVEGNVVSNFAQAGILAWNADQFPRPTDNVFRNNYIFDNPANGEILVRGLANTVIAYNYLSLANAGSSTAGLNFSSFTENGVFSGGASQVEVFGNTVSNAIFPNFSTGDTTAAAFFRNRYFYAPGGFNAIKPAASIKWDANVYTGGNFWSTFAASGNPSRTTPFPGFADPATGALTGHLDRFPFRNEDFGQDHAVTVFLPDARTIAAPGSNQTISWRTNGCVKVDVIYTGPSSGTIVSNYPDVGFYDWVVPAATAGTSYVVTVSCKNSGGAALGTQGSSAAFTIAAGGLLLRHPGADAMTNAGTPLRVAWQRTAAYATGVVNVYLQTSSGLSSLLTSSSGDFADITVPSTATSRAKIVIRAATNSSIQDSTDAYFSIRTTGTGAFVNPSSGAAFLVGSVVNLEWVSPVGSQFVDVELFDPDTSQFRTTYGNVRDFVLNLPDRGRYAYLVGERWMPGAHFRLTFKDGNGGLISTLNSPAFDIRYTLSTGSLTAFYRLFSPITFEHLLTTDANEYNVLSGPGGGWVGESNPPAPVDQILTGDYQIGGVKAVPFYRLYNSSSRQHHWTSSRHEYFVLRESPDFAPEHLVGYIFPSQVSGSTALYRLAYPILPLHLWTSGANEYNVLSGPGGGWVGEGAAGYIFCAANDTQHPGCASALPPQSLTASESVVAALSPQTFPSLLTGARGAGAVRPLVRFFVNSASMESANVSAAGEIVSLKGVGLGPAVPAEPELVPGKRVPTQLAGVSVTFDDVAAPLLLASDLEIRALVPNTVFGRDRVTVHTQVGGVLANSFEVDVAEAAPGLFTTDASGKGQSAALNQGGVPNSVDHPAARGTVVSLYVTGEGLGTPELENGELPTRDRTSRPLLPVFVQIGGVASEVLYSGTVPGLLGVLQIDVRVPQAVSEGSVPVVVTVGSRTTQAAVTLAIR